jgi:hypothetical protein
MKKLKTYVHLYFFLSVWNTHIFEDEKTRLFNIR